MMENKAFCPVLWHQYYVNPWENRVCCSAAPIGGGQLDQNCEDIKRIRLQMLKGERPQECWYCHNVEDKGGSSVRHENLKSSTVSEQLARSVTKPDGSTDYVPYLMDIRPSSICNYACVTCFPIISSKWLQDRDIIEPFFPPGAWDKTRLSLMEDDLWIQVPKILHEMSKKHDYISLHMAGGEPLMDKKALAIMDFLIESKISEKTVLILTTNGSFVDDKMAIKFTRFKRAIIGVSVDGPKRVNDYIRFPGKFEHVEKAFEFLMKRKLTPRISFTTSALSAFYFDELYDWLFDGCEILMNWVDNPHYMKVDCLPQAFIQKTINKYENGKTEYHQRIANYMKTAKNDPDLEKQFKEYLIRLDAKRGTDHKKTFPEICEHIY